MTPPTCNPLRLARTLAATVIVSAVLAGCAAAPLSPVGSADARDKLTRLQADTSLAKLAPVEIREAEAAVQLAEQPVGNDNALGDHRVYVADRKIEIATARASTRLAESQRFELSQARDEARLAARTREADSARKETAATRREAEATQARAELAAAEARREAEAIQARAELAEADAASKTAEAERNAQKLQRQIDELKAEATDRGLVLTLGNTLFDTGRSDLKPFAANGLDKLVAFLNNYPARNVAIEGHTDNVGSVEMNQTLSQHRADSVKSYLMEKGIQSRRLTATGIGETSPIADNQTESGRQQNRRVEIIISKQPSAVPVASIN